MDALHWVLGLLALAGVAAAIWGFLLAGRIRAQGAGDAARLGAAEKLAKERYAELEQSRAGLAEARELSAGLREQLRAAEERADARVREVKSVSLAREQALAEKAEALEKRIAALNAEMKAQFESLAGQTLERASASLLKLASERLGSERERGAGELDKRAEAFEKLVTPIKTVLEQTGAKLDGMEKAWKEDKGRLESQLGMVTQSGELLRVETSKLVKALGKPEVRGRYGEIQLRRVAELAGMTAYCDFDEQASVRGEDNELKRPDMVVRLPNDRTIAVDAKTNTHAYVEAAGAATDEEREAHLARFARHVRDQAEKLSRKEYWREFASAPEFTVMFVPGDQFLDAALAREPDLLEFAARKQIILATPSTLIGLLRAVAVGWREARITEQARELWELGKELHERVGTVLGYVRDVGDAIGKAGGHYNKLVGSIEGRMMPTLRKFEDAGAKGGKELPELPEVPTHMRTLEGRE